MITQLYDAVGKATHSFETEIDESTGKRASPCEQIANTQQKEIESLAEKTIRTVIKTAEKAVKEAVKTAEKAVEQTAKVTANVAEKTISAAAPPVLVAETVKDGAELLQNDAKKILEIGISSDENKTLETVTPKIEAPAEIIKNTMGPIKNAWGIGLATVKGLKEITEDIEM